MQHTASLGHAQQSRKSSTIVAGVGAAIVATAVTFAMLSSSGSAPVATTPTTEAPAKECRNVPPLMLYVATTNGGGTVRFREGSYLSPPITLSTEPQPVIFPRARSQTTTIEELVTIEGQATNLVTMSPLSGARHEYPVINGSLALTATWLPFKGC